MKIQIAAKGETELAKKSKIVGGRCEPMSGCCAVESVISIDERGQMVLPKELREKAGVRAGDKFALVSWQKDGRVCCMSLIRTEELSGMVREILGPMLQEISK
jgi:AbrB family looped-hinge helix DNA binding protein